MSDLPENVPAQEPATPEPVTQETQPQPTKDAVETIAPTDPDALKDRVVPINYHNPQVVIDKAPVTPRASDKKETRLPIALHRANDPEIESSSRNSQLFDTSSSEDGQKWLQAVQLANYTRIERKLYLDQYASTTAKFRQFIEFEGNRIANGVAPFSLPKGGGKISGDRAILFLQSTLGSGEQRTILLPASGIWLTLRPSPDTSLSNLETLVGATKEHIGRLTNSLALSNTMVYMVGHLVDFILDSVVDSNVLDATPEILRDLILTTDIHAMATGSASTIYPNGYPMIQPCVADPFNCQFIEENMLNLRYMTIYETARLTVTQRSFIADKTIKRTVDQIKAYQAMGPVTESEVVEVADRNLKVTFKTPTINEYIADGNAWIDAIARMIDMVTESIDGDDTRRRQLIDDQARLTTLRQYGHFIKEVIITDEDGTSRSIQDSLTLNAAVNELSSQDDVLTAVLAGVRRHIGRATIAFVGIPKMPCPACGKSHEDGPEAHPDIVPIDAVNLFFTLLSLKLSLRQNKRLSAV